ncbi:hypothetical protein ACRAR1_04215 [Streptomyces sanyensis]|uniref:hypothetical protein n=1 Tax=Streptomyces sanyensis TaxID=568869 RepID=UPI003D77D272
MLPQRQMSSPGQNDFWPGSIFTQAIQERQLLASTAIRTFDVKGISMAMTSKQLAATLIDQANVSEGPHLGIEILQNGATFDE